MKRESTNVPAEMRSIRTRLFGEIEVSTSVLFSLQFGMPGFETATTFVLVELRTGSRFRWLQSVEIPDLGFIVVDAREVYPDYPIELVRRAIAFCDIDADEEIVALALCRIASDPEPPTVNLLAPIGLGLRSRRGAQILLHEAELTMTMPLAI